jgi:Xaa-Pro aminopeptidase
MALHFTREEFAAGGAAACDALKARGLDGLLIFRQESMFYLTGYDTFGYVFFQCLYLNADGAFVLLTRALTCARPSTPRSSRTSASGRPARCQSCPRAACHPDAKHCRGQRLGRRIRFHG